MTRTTAREEAQVTRVSTVTVTTYSCNGCGKPIDPDDSGEENCAHELEIRLDQQQCVNFYRRRDFCPACLSPVWEAINRLLGVADPWVERDRDYAAEDEG